MPVSLKKFLILYAKLNELGHKIKPVVLRRVAKWPESYS